MGKKAPKAPDAMQTAQQQSAFSKQAAGDTLKMNSIDRSGPFGSSTFQRDSSGMPTGINSSLSPDLQGSAGNVTGALGTSTGLLPSTGFNPTVDASGIRSAYQDNAMLQAQPEWARQDKQNEVRMAERGLPIGSEAWGDVQNQVGEQRNQYMRGAANDSYIAGTQEEQRQYDNQLGEYKLPWETSANSLGLLQGYNGLIPQAQQPQASVQTPDYMGASQNSYNAAMNQYNNQMSGLGQLAGTGLGLLTSPLTGAAGLSNTLLGRAFA